MRIILDAATLLQWGRFQKRRKAAAAYDAFMLKGCDLGGLISAPAFIYVNLSGSCYAKSKVRSLATL